MENMIKVAVFGCGWGGELFADYLERELAVVEIIKINDYEHAPYGKWSFARICELTEAAVRSVIGSVDIVVLASCAATVGAIEYLRDKYPEQKFVGFEPRMVKGLGKINPRRIMLVASELVRKSLDYKVEREKLALFAEIIEPDCLEWLEYADKDEMTKLRLKRGLERQGIETAQEADKRVEAVIIYETSLADMKEAFEEVVGWQAIVVDGFRQAYREVCGALKLVGLDSNVSRRLK